MVVPEGFENFKLKGIKQEASDDRRLEQVIDLDQFIDHKMNRGAEDSAELSLLSYSISVEEFTAYTLVLLVEFENPLSVSTGSEKDYLTIKFKESSFFISKQTGKGVSSDKEIVSQIPRQFPSSDSKQRVEAVA